MREFKIFCCLADLHIGNKNIRPEDMKQQLKDHFFSVMKKAKYFITCGELTSPTVNELHPENVRRLLVPNPRRKTDDRQLTFDFGGDAS